MNKPAHITLYHSTTTGLQDSTIASLRKNGIRAPQGVIAESGQLNGFFLNSSETNHRRFCGEWKLDNDPEFAPASPGAPLFITAQCRITGLEHDYEAAELPKSILRAFERELCEAPRGMLPLPGRHVIETISQAQRGGLEGLHITLTDQKTSMPFPKALFMPWDHEMQGGTALQSQAALLETMRHYLAAREGHRFLSHESNAIMNEIARDAEDAKPLGVNFKVRDAKDATIMRMEAMRHDAWEDVPLQTPHRTFKPRIP